MTRPASMAGVAAMLSLLACQTLPDTPATAPPPFFRASSSSPCASALVPDVDGDSIADTCELELARAFAPVLVVSAAACNWDASVSPPRPGGGYYFAVDRARPGGALRIAYLPAYYRDCGWSGAKCLVPFTGCDGHDGDSEIIIVELGFDEATSAWRAEGVFLSSHCFARLTGSCRWYREGDLGGFAWSDAAPVVWVAEGSNAGYPTAQACDAGHLRLDTCDRNHVRVRYPVLSPRQNIGSARRPARPGGCYPGGHAGWRSTAADSVAAECFWMPTPFRGWQADAVSGSTPYLRYLREIAEFYDIIPVGRASGPGFAGPRR